MIRASSPGLGDASLIITSSGGPDFVAGQSPIAKSRPYVRFDKSLTNSASTSTNIIFGRDNPTRASSEAPGHGSSLANDGNISTFWQAAKGETNAWWEVDLERMLVIKKTQLVFPTPGNHRYKIEISPDRTNWKVFANESRRLLGGTNEINIGMEIPGRFLRVTLNVNQPKHPPALSEVQVWGHLQSQ